MLRKKRVVQENFLKLLLLQKRRKKKREMKNKRNISITLKDKIQKLRIRRKNLYNPKKGFIYIYSN